MPCTLCVCILTIGFAECCCFVIAAAVHVCIILLSEYTHRTCMKCDVQWHELPSLLELRIYICSHVNKLKDVIIISG